MSEIEYSRVKCIVLDAFGTIAQLTHPLRPYSALREILAERGIIVDDFPVRAMTAPLSLAGLAKHYGVELSMEQMMQLEANLFQDLSGLTLAPGLLHLQEIGIRVVIGSNLGLPYGVVLERMLASQGVSLESLSPSARFGKAFSYEMGQIKPSPDFYTKIETMMGLPAHSFLMIGDRPEEDRAAPMAGGWQTEWAFNRVEASPKVWEELVGHFAADSSN
jgi:hypothetical protein